MLNDYDLDLKMVNEYDVDILMRKFIDKSRVIRHYESQINTIDNKYNEEFLRYCQSISNYTVIEELGGIPPNENKEQFMRRYTIDKTFDEVIHKADTGLACGIKVVPTPTIKLFDYHLWENGYIESFIRMDADSRGVEWFIWQYIKMNHLKNLLEKFQDKLKVLKV